MSFHGARAEGTDAHAIHGAKAVEVSSMLTVLPTYLLREEIPMSSTDEKTITKKTTLRVTVGDPWPSAKAGARHDGPPGWGTLSPRTREVVGGLAVSIYAERSGDPLPELAAMFTKALRGAWAPGDIPDAPVIESTIEHGSWRRADLECHGPVAYSATIDVDVFSALARQNHMRVAGK